MLLIVSELVTNALRHGGGTWTMDLTAHPDSIEVAVHDPSPQVPRMRTPDLNGGTGGFGWPMVNRLAHTTAVTLQADWSLIRLPGAPVPSDPRYGGAMRS